MDDQPFSLLKNLAKAETNDSKRTDGKLSFVSAMDTLNIHSVFDIVRRSKAGFVRDLSSISDADGALAYENARCYATQIVRLYRNQLVSSGRNQLLSKRTGVRSLVDIGPSFPNLFKENWDLFCKVGAIEAKDSPVAYLTSLYRFAREELEGSPAETNRITLDDRRPDLKNLIIDQQSTFTPIPTLQIVNQVLSEAIHAYTDTVSASRGKSIYKLVAEKHHPFLFPYNFHYQQIRLGLVGKKPILGELSYRMSLETPATAPATRAYGKVQNSSVVAQVMMSGLGPEQQKILLEPALPAESESHQAHMNAEKSDPISQFFKLKYDVDYATGMNNPLNSFRVFMEQTGLDSDEVEKLLAVGSHTPYASPNILPDAMTGGSSRYGASYVNGLDAQESMSLGSDAQGARQLLNTSVDRFDRLQRMIRLQRWMGIPFSDLDTLVMAVIRSEGVANPEAVLTTNTLRALGVWRYLNTRYGLAADEFSTLIHHMAGEANDGRLSLFDRVFNSPLLYDAPVVMDGVTIIYPSGTNQALTVRAQLSAALKLPDADEGLRLLLEDIILLSNEPWSRFILMPSMMSSLYRQARIAWLFGMTVKDSRALIDLLGGEVYRKQVINGELTKTPDAADGEPDILDILMQLDWASTWLKETGQDIATLRRQLGAEAVENAVTQEVADLLDQLALDAQASALTQEQLVSLNTPTQDDGNKPIDWWNVVLAPLIGDHGLVTAQPLDQDAGNCIGDVIREQLIPIELSEEIKVSLAASLEAFVLKGYLTQHRLMEGLLQSVASLPMDRCEPVMRWAGSSVDQFLGAVLDNVDARQSGSSTSDSITEKLMTLTRYAGVNQQLGLTAQALRIFLTHPHWLHAGLAETLPLSLNSLYLLDRYRHWRDRCGHPEALLLDYLRRANNNATVEQSAALLALLIGWSSSEVQSASTILTTRTGVAMSTHEVDWLNRMHSVSETTGLTARQLLDATGLTPLSAADKWKTVGEAIMSSSR